MKVHVYVSWLVEILNSGHCHQLTFRFHSSLYHNSNGVEIKPQPSPNEG